MVTTEQLQHCIPYGHSLSQEISINTLDKGDDDDNNNKSKTRRERRGRLYPHLIKIYLEE